MCVTCRILLFSCVFSFKYYITWGLRILMVHTYIFGWASKFFYNWQYHNLINWTKFTIEFYSFPFFFFFESLVSTFSSNYFNKISSQYSFSISSSAYPHHHYSYMNECMNKKTLKLLFFFSRKRKFFMDESHLENKMKSIFGKYFIVNPYVIASIIIFSKAMIVSRNCLKYDWWAIGI